MSIDAEAVLLDALGTLVELEPPAPLLRRQLAQRLGVRVEEVDAQRAIAAEIAYYRAHLDDGRDPHALAALRRQCAAVVRENLPAVAQSELGDLDRLTEALLASLRFRIFPDVLPALRSLRTGGVRLAVVSNWDVSLHDVLERLGVTPLLDAVVTSAEAGSRKPAPEIFRRALTRAGAVAERTIHVGDSVEEDIAGARAVRIEPVLLSRGEQPEPPAGGVRVIRSLAEL